MMPSAESIAVALEGRRRGDRWWAKCVSHDERTASLSIRELNGVVLLRCFGGCENRDIIRALRARGLWPEYPIRTSAERHAWGVQRRRAEAEARDCLAWHSVLCSDMEQDKAAAAGDEDPWPRFEPAARELARLTGSTPVDLLAEFRRRSVREARETGRLVSRGRAVYECCRVVAGMVLAHWRKEAASAMPLDSAGATAHNPIAGPDRTGALADPGGALPRPATRIPLGEGTDATKRS